MRAGSPPAIRRRRPRARDPRGGRQRGRRSGRRRARLLRRRDGHDRAARRRSRDLLRRRRRARRGISTASARYPASAPIGASRSSCTSTCRSAPSSCTTRSGPRRARCRASPAGLGALWEAHGRLPWPRLVEPALRLARDGVEMPPAHVACLAMLEPVMTMHEGARIYAPGGRLLRPASCCASRASSRRSSLLADEGAAGAYRGTIGRALLDARARARRRS